MAKVTNTVGMILMVVGLVGYLISDTKHWTAFLPAILGLILIVLGTMALRSESASKHLMHAAMVVALVGIIGTFSRALGIFDGGTAAVSSAITLVVLVVFLVLGIRSFIAARRS